MIQDNFNYDHDSNGERWILKTLADAKLLTNAFDVGANQGDWTALVLEVNPSAVVHSFEICPPTFQKLSTRFAEDKRVILNESGLSDSEGEIEMKYSTDDTLSSMFEVVCSQRVQAIRAKVTRGKDYCLRRNLEAISFLKVDVEGAEHLVLSGFDDLLNPARIPIVQFEYGMVNIVTKFLLRDFYSFFERRGYKVGKLFPKRVRFRDYRFEDEDLRGPNFVAASAERVPLLRGNVDVEQPETG